MGVRKLSSRRPPGEVAGRLPHLRAARVGQRQSGARESSTAKSAVDDSRAGAIVSGMFACCQDAKTGSSRRDKWPRHTHRRVTRMVHAGEVRDDKGSDSSTSFPGSARGTARGQPTSLVVHSLRRLCATFVQLLLLQLLPELLAPRAAQPLLRLDGADRPGVAAEVQARQKRGWQAEADGVARAGHCVDLVHALAPRARESWSDAAP